MTDTKTAEPTMRELELELELVNTRTQFLFSQTQLMQIDLRECKQRAIVLHQQIEQRKNAKLATPKPRKRATRKAKVVAEKPEHEAGPSAV